MFRLALSVRGASAEALQAVSHRLFPGALPDFFTVAYEIERYIGSSPAAPRARGVSWSYWRADASLSAPCPRPDDMQVFAWREGNVRYRIKRSYKRVEGRWAWIDSVVRVGCSGSQISPCEDPAAQAPSHAVSA